MGVRRLKKRMQRIKRTTPSLTLPLPRGREPRSRPQRTTCSNSSAVFGWNSCTTVELRVP